MMKWLLLFALSLCSFLAHADKCEVTSGGNKSGNYSFRPLTMSGQLVTKNIEASETVVKCESMKNVEIYVNAGLPTNEQFVFNVGDKYYRIDFTTRSKSSWGGLPLQVSYNLEDILTGSAFSLDYKIVEVSGSSGLRTITPGVPFPLVSAMEIKVCQGNATNCATTKFNYTLNITLQVNLMTCGFKDQSVDMGEFQLFSINKEPYQVRDIKFNCVEGEHGILNFRPGSLDYYFEPNSGVANGTTILKNELESISSGTGQIGFQISMDGTKEVQFGRNNVFKINNLNKGDMVIPIYIRPRMYGANVSSGKINSKARVIVIYN